MWWHNINMMQQKMGFKHIHFSAYILSLTYKKNTKASMLILNASICLRNLTSLKKVTWTNFQFYFEVRNIIMINQNNFTLQWDLGIIMRMRYLEKNELSEEYLRTVERHYAMFLINFMLVFSSFIRAQSLEDMSKHIVILDNIL